MRGAQNFVRTETYRDNVLDIQERETLKKVTVNVIVLIATKNFSLGDH